MADFWYVWCFLCGNWTYASKYPCQLYAEQEYELLVKQFPTMVTDPEGNVCLAGCENF